MTDATTVDTVTPATVQNGSDSQLSLFASLATDAYEFEGYDLQKDKSPLVGVPFVIVGATFRDGNERVWSGGITTGNYVSLEIVLGDAAAFQTAVARGRMTLEQARSFEPNERLVINDGSTGICRQITHFLHAAKIIDVPDGPEDGPAGESRYDMHWSLWNGADPDGGHPFYEFTLLCKRGLRVSEYEYGTKSKSDATTFYIA